MVLLDDHPLLQLDKQFSFDDSFIDGDEDGIPKPDAMHKAVSREAWNKVSLQLFILCVV